MAERHRENRMGGNRAGGGAPKAEAATGGVREFVPPPMETITGKSMAAQDKQKRAACDFVPPSVEMMSGKSVVEPQAWEDGGPADGEHRTYAPFASGIFADEGGGAGMPLVPVAVETPESVQSPYFSPGYLRRYIGRNVRVEFLIGSIGALSDRVGTLMEVGATYIVLQPVGTDDLLMCDLFSIEFVNILR